MSEAVRDVVSTNVLPGHLKPTPPTIPTQPHSSLFFFKGEPKKKNLWGDIQTYVLGNILTFIIPCGMIVNAPSITDGMICLFYMANKQALEMVTVSNLNKAHIR